MQKPELRITYLPVEKYFFNIHKRNQLSFCNNCPTQLPLTLLDNLPPLSSPHQALLHSHHITLNETFPKWMGFNRTEHSSWAPIQ